MLLIYKIGKLPKILQLAVYDTIRKIQDLNNHLFMMSEYKEQKSEIIHIRANRESIGK